MDKPATKECTDCGGTLTLVRGHYIPGNVGPDMPCATCSRAWTIYCAVVEDR